MVKSNANNPQRLPPTFVVCLHSVPTERHRRGQTLSGMSWSRRRRSKILICSASFPPSSCAFPARAVDPGRSVPFQLRDIARVRRSAKPAAAACRRRPTEARRSLTCSAPTDSASDSSWWRHEASLKALLRKNF
ncbi:hypothetical protein S83_002888 [Arachis hypogaea]